MSDKVMSRESLIPCEICNAYVEFSQYTRHLTRCLHVSHISYPRYHPQEEHEEDHEEEQQEDNFVSQHITHNHQISRMTLYDFITNHFNGAGGTSPPQRSVVWFNLTPPSVQRPAPGFWNRVEKGLSTEQINEVAYTTEDKTELNIQAEDICAVCQDNLSNAAKVCKLACLHTYCDECIKTWLAKSKKCPVCMIDLEDAYLWGR